MALFPEPGSWRGFLEQVSGTGTQFGNDETQEWRLCLSMPYIRMRENMVLFMSFYVILILIFYTYLTCDLLCL